MRDLSFLLRLHALPPLARPSGSLRKPCLPLEVRYIIRPSEEVFLYLSNNPNNKTWNDDLFLFTTERIATFIPSTGNIPLLLKFLPMPAAGGFSYLTNHYIFLGMLCRRGLACHYLPLYEARWRPLYEHPSQENIALPKRNKTPSLFFGFLYSFSVGSVCDSFLKTDTEIPMKRFFPILTASFCIIGLGTQVSSGMILPFEQFPDVTADYKSTATPPVDTLFLTPDEAMGLPLANLKGKKSTRLRESSC